MSKSLAVVSIFICLVALISGLAFTPFKSAAYEAMYGPPLVTAGFCKRLVIALYSDSSVSTEMQMGANDTNPPNFWIRQKLDGAQRVTIVTVFKDGNYTLESSLYTNKDNAVQFESFVFRIDQLNRYIDKTHFPDPKTRAKKKREILNRIAE